MFRIISIILLGFVLAGAQQQKQTTINEDLQKYSALKDQNVQVAALNNSAFTVLNTLLVANASLQWEIMSRDSTITNLKKELEDLRTKVRKK
jgi:hypothetical protein